MVCRLPVASHQAGGEVVNKSPLVDSEPPGKPHPPNPSMEPALSKPLMEAMMDDGVASIHASKKGAGKRSCRHRIASAPMDAARRLRPKS